MLLTMLIALTLGQDPAAAQMPAGPADPAAAAALAAPGPAAAPTARQARVAAQRRNDGEVVCTERPPTGSTLTRRTCRTQRRAEMEAARAQNYIQEVTVGTAHEPMDIGPGPRPN